MDALRCPAGETLVKVLSGGERRRVALCRLLLQKPDILLLDEPTNHLDAESVAWLEHHLQRYAGTVIAVTHDRYFLDNVAGWILELDRGEGIPWKGNYSSWLEQKQNRLQHEEKQESRPPEDPRTRTGMDPDVAQGPPCQVQGPHQRLREAPRRRRAKSAHRNWRSTSRPGPRLGELVIEAERSQGLRRPPPVRGHDLPPAARRHRRRHRPQRRRQDDPVPDDHRAGDSPTPARSGSGDTVKLAYVDQSRDALDPDKTIWEVISGGQGHHPAGQARDELAGLCGPVQLLGHGPAEEGRRSSPAASATGSIWRGCSRRGPTSSCSTSRPTTST